LKLLSLCIPTNGISEWVFPVLDAIYSQKVATDEWEVVVTNNGNDKEFHEKILSYAHSHDNLIYKQTDAFMFKNQIEALKIATGEYLKFVNHRAILVPDTIEWMLSVIKENLGEKPIIFWSNGSLKYKEPRINSTFDGFVRDLREYASWTTGVGVWKSDFETIPEEWIYNSISPHSDVLYWVRDRKQYIIEDKRWSYELEHSDVKKGSYDYYKAFGVEEIMIPVQLYIDGDITAKTLKSVIKSYEKCVAKFYTTFNHLKVPCSYDLSGFKDNMGIFLNKKKVIFLSYMYIPRIFFGRMYYRMIARKGNSK